jgi:hypothetical protein
MPALPFLLLALPGELGQALLLPFARRRVHRDDIRFIVLLTGIASCVSGYPQRYPWQRHSPFDVSPSVC